MRFVRFDRVSQIAALPLLLAVLLVSAGCTPSPADTPEAPPAAPVAVEAATAGPFQPTLTLLGVVRPSGMADVTAPVAGRIDYPGRFGDGLDTGAEVGAGEVLARIASQDSVAELAEARLRVDQTSSELDRHQRAFDAGVESAAALSSYKADAALARARLTAAQQRSGRLSLRAPLHGRLIVDRPVPPGSEIAAGTVLARIAAGGALRIDARAAAADRDLLHPGLGVRFAASGGTPTGRGVIRDVAPVVDAGGTIAVGIEVTDPAGLPAPGEGVEVTVDLDPRPQAFTVPEEALVIAENGSAVFVVERKTGLEAHRRQVETGARGNGRVEVLRGLEPGDRVVVGGAAMLEDGARVSVIAPDKGKAAAGGGQ
jgi:RND family efflux transporter MFP subunit